MQHAAYKVSVPGSIMLLGEHAVLAGYRALACAVDQRLSGELTPLTDDSIVIYSNRLGEHRTSLQKLSIEEPFQFILTAIKCYQPLLAKGFELRIESDFPPTIGLGSSAAVTVATLALLKSWLQPTSILVFASFFEECLAVVRTVQRGLGSGADLAASIYGGIVSLKPKPLSIEKLQSKLLQLVLVYSGKKTPTAKVIEYVMQQKEKFPKLYSTLLEAIGDCSEVGYQAIIEEDLYQFAEIFGIHQGLLKSLGVSNSVIDKIIEMLDEDPGILSSKISGSGLGDCIVGVGHLTKKDIWEDAYWKEKDVMPIDIQISEQGLMYGNR